MRFDYIRTQYDNWIETLFNSGFTTIATINIVGEEVSQESLRQTFGDNLDGRQTDNFLVSYPIDLSPNYQVNVFPIEESSLSMGQNETKYDYGLRFSPYDRWIVIKNQDIYIRDNTKTFLDFTDSIELLGSKYKIKGKIEDNFGNKAFTNVFLVLGN